MEYRGEHYIPSHNFFFFFFFWQIFDNLVPYSKSITGYSVISRSVVACMHAGTYIHIQRYVYALASMRVGIYLCTERTYIHAHIQSRYRNSQFARAFTFEFPLFTFSIVRISYTQELLRWLLDDEEISRFSYTTRLLIHRQIVQVGFAVQGVESHTRQKNLLCTTCVLCVSHWIALSLEIDILRYLELFFHFTR